MHLCTKVKRILKKNGNETILIKLFKFTLTESVPSLSSSLGWVLIQGLGASVDVYLANHDRMWVHTKIAQILENYYIGYSLHNFAT